MDSRRRARPVSTTAHGFIKKTQWIPDEDLALARQRVKEIEQ